MKRISIAALLLLMLILGAEADVFERIGELLDKVEQGLGRIAPITTAVEIIKEGKQRKRNEHELNSMAEQDRFIGNFRATKIKSKAYGAFQLNKIDSTQMMAEYSLEPNRSTVDTLANELGKSTKSIIAKLVSLGVYKKAERTTKTGAKIVSKAELVSQIESHYGFELPSLVKATKNDLQTLADNL